MDAEDWLMDTERKLKTVGCTYVEKVRYATHLLCGPTASWWDNIVAVHPAEKVFTWEEFKRKFRESNVPESVMDLKRREFENLEQKDKAILTYVREFSGLSRYAADEVSDISVPNGPAEEGPLAVGSGFSGSSSSTKSSDEEIASTSSIKPAVGGDLANLFDGMSFGSFTDFDLDSDLESVDNFSFIDKSTLIREVFADRYDGVTDPEDEHTMVPYHQVCVIGEQSRQVDETSETFDDLGNPYIDPADLTRGWGSKYVGPTPRQRVQLSQEAWDRASRALNSTDPMTTTATAEELQAYQYRLADDA
ncbi:hypothetical protein QYE76_015383 [Lolium multiflorum]|uniref:Retrotransposon gag domain-containing protein n=1 Tax=Lolium multiflorum TaxID=4521 RepID=A0AAD8X6Q4_LOLMU|nr:hypothetical protein QYE76_015383 [Lolium multiflorum]